MSHRKRMALAGVCASLGLWSCRPTSITTSPAAIEVDLMAGGKTLETFQQLLDGGLSFGSDPVRIPVRQTLTLVNVGSGDVQINQVFVTPDGGPFSLVGTLPAVVGGAGVPLTVQFDPTEEQSYNATLEIDSDDGTHPMLSIPLTGIGSTEGLLCVSPDPLNFGTVGEGQTQTKSLELLSCGTAELDITSIELGDGGDPAFAIVSSDTIPDGGLFLVPDASIQYFDISFTPTATTPANASGTLVIESSDPTHQPYVVELTGQPVLAPIAIIDAGASAALGETITLDGLASYDPNIPPLGLTYSWTLGPKPLDSTAGLSSITDPQPTITLDAVGPYTFLLTVTNDAGVPSIVPAHATVYAKPTDDLYVEMIWTNVPVDMDLHFLIDGGVFGAQGDCNAYDPDAGFSCTPGSDHLSGPGPETAGVAIPPPADYEVECKYYAANDATSDTTLVIVRAYVYGVLAAQVCQQMDSTSPVWSAATITWPSGTVTLSNDSVPCPETN